MKTATLGNTTRTVGKMFIGLALLVLAVGAGFGGTALLVYHQLGGSRPADSRVAEHPKVDRKEPARTVAPIAESAVDQSQTRQVAAINTDASAYTFADNNSGQPTLPTKRVQKPVTNIPAELETPATPEPAPAGNLNDPESHYIVDARTGRVVGIDGTVGARREAEEEQRRLNSAPRAMAVQTPPPEVRVASAVMDQGQPVYHGAQPVNVNVPGSQYVPVRKALPVAPNDVVATNPESFRVAAYLADDRNRPTLRAQAAYPTSNRVARSSHVFRLPDGTQAVVSD